jgi:cobalt-precorrin 5A hydrolase
MIVAGIGCRRDCPGEAIVELVRAAESQAGARVSVLAAPAAKAHEQGLHDAAAALGVTLMLVEQDDLVAAQALCVTHSACAQRSMGVSSVAEGCALAASGAVALLLARIASKRATCALAEGTAR